MTKLHSFACSDNSTLFSTCLQASALPSHSFIYIYLSHFKATSFHDWTTNQLLPTTNPKYKQPTIELPQRQTVTDQNDMRTSLFLSVLLGAGVIAHPHYKLNNPLAHHRHRRQDPILAVEYFKNAQGQTTEVLDIVEATSTVYVGGASPPTPVAAAQPVEAASEVNVKADYHVQAAAQNQQPKKAERPEVPAPAPAPKAAPEPAPAPAPAPKPAPVKEKPASPPSSSGGSGATVGGQNILDVANKWRSKQGLPTFTWDEALATVSANTNAANGANSMTHHRVPPSLGQVIAEGSSTKTASSSQGELGPIDLLWLDWICELSGEIPGFPCSDALGATNMDTNGETIHAEILMNPQYTKLGCNYMDATDPAAQGSMQIYQGMFVCDVAF